MSTRLPSDLLARPAEESSRLLALSYLDEIGRAEKRLEDPQDAEALHDFRVGLRRLRSSSRAYRLQLKGSISKRVRRRLRKLTQATNAGRDAEVHLAWLGHQAEQLGPEDLQGLSWLIGRLEGRSYDMVRTATAGAREQFSKTAAKLRPRLGTFRMEVRAGSRRAHRSFGQVTGELIRAQVAELADDLKRVQGAEDVKGGHSARISAKRLRYLLEPLARRVPGGKGLVTQLKEVQDSLGDLHDRHMLAEEIGSTRSELSCINSDRLAGCEPGLRTLERLAQEQTAAAFARFDAWSGAHAGIFISRVERLAVFLAEGAAPAPAVPVLSLGQARQAGSTNGAPEGQNGGTAETLGPGRKRELSH
ncbi:MAG: CHAD domain-containing protein [Gemmatimonadales bacterium]